MATQQAPTQDFSDQQLQQFADASQEIAVISQEYTQRLQEAEDEATQQEVRAEANDRMIEVVEDSGLDVDTFNAIGQSIQQDPEMMQRVQEMANQS
jgi:GTP1/Obg family GTP-binding protein